MIGMKLPAFILLLSTLNCYCYAKTIISKEEGDELLIGWSSTDITPGEAVSIGGGAQARVFDSASDPITATVLVLESFRSNPSGDLAIMISVDYNSPRKWDSKLS